MSRTQADPTRGTTDEEETRGRILDAALTCFSQIGIAKTSLQDVAQVAGVSRGTVYRYFEDRRTLIDAAIDLGSHRYWADAATALSRKPTLAGQVGALAEVVAANATAQHTRDRLVNGDTALMQMILSDAESTLKRTMSFLLPYIEQAAVRGEVGAGVDHAEAAEWLARMVMSIVSTPGSPSFDVSRPRSVSRFVERHATAGLTGLR